MLTHAHGPFSNVMFVPYQGSRHERKATQDIHGHTSQYTTYHTQISHTHHLSMLCVLCWAPYTAWAWMCLCLSLCKCENASRVSINHHAVQGSKTPHPDPSTDGAETPSFRASAAQSTEAARKSASELWTSLRATYNSVAETLSEVDFRPLGKQAAFVK